MMTTKQQSESLDQTTRIDPKPLCACRCGSLTNSPAQNKANQAAAETSA